MSRRTTAAKTRFNLRRQRTRNRLYDDIVVTIHHISVKEGVRRYGEAADSAIKAKLSPMLAKQVWSPVHRRTIPESKKIIPSFIFLKDNFDAEGNVDKLKARLVAGEHLLQREYIETSSPTASLAAIFLVASILMPA